MENDDIGQNNFQKIYPEHKERLTLEYLEMRVKRLSQEQLDKLYKRLLEVDDGNIIIPDAE